MVVDRLLFALAAAGIVWMATPSKRPSDPAPVCTEDGGLPQRMQGPFDSLEAATGSDAVNVRMRHGAGTFDELTVMGAETLVVRVDHRWFRYRITGTGAPLSEDEEAPIWIDVEAGAPRIVDDTIVVQFFPTRNYSRGVVGPSSGFHFVTCRVAR